ncbi:PIG-L family deacetylase [Granulicella tundricola]|uniref:PIG-L family deacetylase n=1 Tax=Granulicella tundricola TaxID=940615 RepID=UPI0002D38B23|nr:PIG-L family deacetylase [Granulicella tundricola]
MPSLAFAQQNPQAKDPANLMGERTSAPAHADTLEINHGAPALEQLLKKLRTRASLMMIVAHPDDEDGGMLTYESRGQGARVAMLTLTRGEGGQNLMSADFNDALGLIRTQELLAADRYLGVDQMFGTEVDFGFSKTKEETLAQWTHERVLYDAVRAVRLYRPLVLASVFVGGPTDGHGHHQTSGEICQEVFTAAADPKVFPEMGLPPWAPLKVYARVPFSRVTKDGMFDYATGRTIPPLFHNYVTNTDSTGEPVATVEIPEGEKSTLLGMHGDSYVQFARKGLALQKTQIGEGVRTAPAGALSSGYSLKASRTGSSSAQEKSFFDGVDTTLTGIANLAPAAPASLRTTLASIDKQVADAESIFTPENIELTAPPLRDALRSLDTLLAEMKAASLPEEQKYDLLHELRTKRVQLNQALVLAHHLSVSATLADPKAGPEVLSTLTSLAVKIKLDNKSANSYRIAGIHLTANTAGQGIGQADLGAIQPRTTRELPIRLPYLAGLVPTRPYFSRPNLEQPFYNVKDANLRNAPATPYPISAGVQFDDQGVRLDLETVVQATDDAKGPQPVVIVPPVTVSLSSASGIVPLDMPSFPLETRLRVNATDPAACHPVAKDLPKQVAKLSIRLSNDWLVAPGIQDFDPHCAVDKSYAFTISPPHRPEDGTIVKAQAVARSAAYNYTESFRAVGYAGLTPTNFYTPAIDKVTAVDVKTAPNLKVAYLPGTGDSVAEFLPDLGITPTMLTVADLTAQKLASFDAVILGVRAYSAHPELAGAGSKPLLDFAANGGIVLVQYNSGGSSGHAAPYPFDLPGDSAHNVVVEAQPVTFLAPESPALNWPNKLTSADFEHWVEEWGHGFASTWDSHYEALLEVHDPDQDPQKGGLLLARTGKGAYIYCALALYRSLPEGVPGAYRLLANLLSLRQNPGFVTDIKPSEAKQNDDD